MTNPHYDPKRFVTFSEAVGEYASQRGWAILPCNAKKISMTPHGYKDATNDFTTLMDWSSLYNPPYAGIRTGEKTGLFVVDIDVWDNKNDTPKSGLENFKAWVDGKTWPKTWIAQTASGGWHYYFKYPKGSGLTIKPNSPCQDVDYRGEGGHVVAYRFIEGHTPDDIPLAELPEWYIEAISGSNTQAQLSNSEQIYNSEGLMVDGREDYKKKQVYVECLNFVKDHRRKAEPKEETELATQIQIKFADKCTTHGRSYDETLAKVRSTFKNMDIEAVLTTRSEDSLTFFKATEYDFDKKCEYLIKNMLNKNTMSVVYGAPACGKSFFMLDVSMAIARGTGLNGHKVKQGAILYCALEGAGGFMKRVKAYIDHNQVEEDTPFYISTDAVFLYTKDGADKLTQLIQDIEDTYGEPPSMVVIDTLARTMSPGNENDATDMGILTNNVEAVKSQTNCHICLVHHTGKDEKRGARGSNALLAAVDTELHVVDSKGLREVVATKQKDLDGGKLFNFRLEVVELWEDEDGDMITSCVVEYTDEQIDKTTPISGNQGIALKALELIISEGEIMTPIPGMARVRCVELSRWKQEALKMGLGSSTSNPDAVFNAAKIGLIKKEKVMEYDKKIWLTERVSIVG